MPTLPGLDRLRGPVAAAVLLLALLLAAPAQATPISGSAYDSGDGDQVDSLGLDWQGATAAGRVTASPDANDDCFVGGVKELAPKDWAFNRSAGGCTPGKSNLRVGFASSETVPTTSFGHFGFFRNDTTGNSFLTFELNQRAGTWVNATGTSIPCRENGDLLLSIEVGGSSMTSSLYKWRGDRNATPGHPCPDGGTGTFTGSGPIAAGARFQGAMNGTAAISNYVEPARYGASFPANAFGEAALDLPAVLRGMGESPCFAFVQMQIHSRSSSSISSAMIDYTTPVPVDFQSCAATGTAYEDTDGDGGRDGGEPALAGTRFYADLDDDGTLDAGEPSGVSGATGSFRILSVPAGSVRIRPEARSGYACSQPSPCSYQRSIPVDGNSTGNDFGFLGPSSASGTAFDDLDADGLLDAGEPGRTALTVFADLDDDGALDAGEPSGVTDAMGAWTVTGIPAGTHRIRPALTGGLSCSAPSPCSAAFAFTSGSTLTGAAFGVWAPATIGGRVYEDLDGDGDAMEGGDAAVAGRQVFLDADGDDAFDLGEPVTTTDASGLYSFTGLRPGGHTARVASAAGWYCTRPATCEQPATVTSGQAASGRDLGLSRFATVSGAVFDDVDGDGVRDAGEGPLAGFTQWVDYDDDNALDAGEPSAATDAAGAYAIAGVAAGSWTLRQQPNGAYACTRPSPCAYALTLPSNGAATAREFGDFVSRSVSGTVFNDGDADGTVPEAGDAGLAGWTVYSDNDNDTVHDAGEPVAVTNSLGVYNLTGLANGNYRIRLVGQAGWTCSTPADCLNTGSIGSGQSDTGKNFGVWGPSTVSGTVFDDLDGDGAPKEAGEPGVAGRTVYVDADDDGVLDAGERTATSSASGTWSVAGLNPGTYVVRQVLPAGTTCTRPAPCAYTVVTASGSLTGKDFGSYAAATVSGTVLEDLDADGDGDAPLGSRTVYADLDGDGSHDGGEPSATSTGGGGYTISGLAPGSYTIRQVLPAGWTQSAPAAGHAVTATSGATPAGRDFASYTTGSVSGALFEDADFDGSPREGGDAPVAGRDVYVDADGDGARDAGEPAATSDGAGAYALTDLAPGTYTVRPQLPAGWACVLAGCSRTITVASGAAHAGEDFGGYVGATVSGTVFEDADADGAPREAGEPGAAGRRVYLDGDADGVRDAGEPTALTAADGSYAFDGVTARTWTLRLDLPAAWSCDSSPCSVELTLSSGSVSGGHELGVHTTGTIAGHLFTDRDADGGPQVFGENDQPERTVFLDLDDDGELDGGERGVVTDDTGDFRFEDVQPGAYRVRQVLPAGWECAAPAPCRHDVTVASGHAVSGLAFSSWTTAALTGVYFEDDDADGEYPEPGEPGLAGRTVYLDLDASGTPDAGEPSTTTDAGGAFAFAGLPPGSYRVRAAAQPAGWTCSYPSPCDADLTLEAAERAQDLDFGAYTDGEVRGTLFDDADRDGSRGTGEVALAGWSVYDDADGDGARDPGEATAATDAAGAYTLRLAPGSHTIRQVTRAGWRCGATPCAHTVDVTSSDTVADRDFANSHVTSVAGSVFVDDDADGTRDAGEAPRAAAVVHADADGDGTRGAGEPSATTDADGAYVLEVAPGTPSVRLELPAGFECSSPADCERTPAVAPGDAVTGQDFAIWEPGTITGAVSDDLDGDGTRGGGEPGLGGLTVWADLDGDGTPGASEPTAVTAHDGTYALTGVRPGTHAVRVDVAADQHCTGLSSCAGPVTVTSGASLTHAVGVWRESSVSGAVFEDADGDGAAREPGEGPLAGRTVQVDRDDDGDLDAGEPSTTTGADGSWKIDGLAPGRHAVRVVADAGWSCSRPAPCRDAVTATSGSAVTAADFALTALVADLGVALDRAPGALVAGRPASWTATVRNGGPLDATGVTLTLEIPTGLRDVTWTPPAGVSCSRAGATLACAIGALADGADVAVQLSGTVAPDAGGDPLSLEAAVTGDQPDPRSADDAASEAPVPGAVADLLASATLPGAASVGDRVPLVLTVVNDGPSDADGLVLTATLPDGLTAASAGLPAGCTVSGRDVTCTASGLPAGGTITRTIEVEIGPAAGGHSIVVPVSATSSTPDPTPANNAADAGLRPDPSADLQIAVEPAPQPAGDGYSYGLVVTNAGPSDATGVVVSDGPFPAGVRITSVTTDHGTCAVRADGGMRCELGDVPVGTEVRITVTLAVDAGVDPAAVQPSPVARGQEGDPAPSDNTARTALPPRAAAPVVTPAPPVEVTGPEARTCASRRAFWIKVRRRRDVRYVAVRMWLAGKPLEVGRRKGRWTARVDLRNRRPGHYKLRIRARTATGAVLRGARTYHTCVRRRPHTVPKL